MAWSRLARGAVMLAIVIGLAAAGCTGCAKTCGSSSCPGYCDSKGQCQTGAAGDADAGPAAAAVPAAGDGQDAVAIVGWTRDSRYFVYELSEEEGRYAVILDAETLRGQTLVLQPSPADLRQIAPEPKTREYRSWLDEHPLSTEGPPQLPNGASRPADADPKQAVVSPDGVYAAWVLPGWVQGPSYGSGSIADCFHQHRQIFLTGTRPTRVKAVGDHLGILLALERVGHAAHATGLALSSVAFSKTPRMTGASVVSAPANALAEARALAARLPGGAEVEAAPKTQTEIVVGLGENILGPDPRPEPGITCSDRAPSQSYAGTRNQLEVLGWTRDERYLVIREKWLAGGESLEAGTTATVIDTALSCSESFMLSVELEELDAEALSCWSQTARNWSADHSKFGSRRRFGQWLSGQGLTANLGRVAPDGLTTAELSAGFGRVGTRRQGFVWSPPQNGDDEEHKIRFHLGVRRGGEVRAAGVLEKVHETLLNEQIGIPAVGEVSVSWSPGGTRMAWLVVGELQSMVFRNFVLAVTPAGRPRIHLVAGPGIRDRAEPVVRLALHRAGYLVLEARPATAERANSEVFYADGFKPQAEQVAAAIPGGAVARPLTWKVEADLVVAVGASVLGE